MFGNHSKWSLNYDFFGHAITLSLGASNLALYASVNVFMTLLKITMFGIFTRRFIHSSIHSFIHRFIH